MFFVLKNGIIKNKNRGGILDVIISFFRDFLSGPLYIVVAIISAIGIIACIGYLAEATLKQKELEKKQKEMYAEVHFLPTDESSASAIATNVETALSSAQLQQVGHVDTTNIAQSEALVTSDMVSAVTGTSVTSAPTSSPPKESNTTSEQQQ